MYVPPFRFSLRALLSPDAPDAALVQAGFQGEQWLARARLWLFTALWLIPISWLVTRDQLAWELQVGLGAATSAVVVAAALARLARHPRLPRWFGLVSGALDVTLVTVALAAFVVVGQPWAAINSTITFELYFLGLAATALRYDWRVCALAGLVAVAEYGGLAAWVAATADTSDAAWLPAGYGTFRWSTVVGRSIVLAFASAIAAALVVRAGRLRIASVRDRLTNLANRAYFDERLAEEIGRAHRTGQSLAVALIDLDRFKEVNDVHGHAAGDAVLRAVGATLRQHVRGHDVVARYGGEEFGLIFVDAPASAAVARVDALRTAIARLRVPIEGGETVALTASAGVAMADEATGDAEQDAQLPVVHLADERLYAAKAAGRDAVVGPAPRRRRRTRRPR